MKCSVFVCSMVIGLSASLAQNASLYNQGVDSYQRGKPAEAKGLLQEVSKADPDYANSRCYMALSQHQLGDRLGFLKTMEDPSIRTANVPATVREKLGANHVEALFYYRKFDDLLAKAETLEASHPNSIEMPAVREYRLAALFERGMKKTIEACASSDTNVFNQRWPEGRASLEAFIEAAQSLTNYAHVLKRNLREDVWVARMTLGGEQAVLAEVPLSDPAARERVSFLRSQLYFKLQPEQLDLNIQLMNDFIRNFPESKHRRRTAFDLTTLSHRRSKQLWLEAEAASLAGDEKLASSKRAEMGRYLDLQESRYAELAVDKSAGIEPSDMFDQREDLLTGYMFQKKFAAASSMTSKLLASADPGDLDWMLAKLNNGIMARLQDPVGGAGAAELDEVLAQGFKGRSDHDHLVVEAARWRFDIAMKAGDTQKAGQLIVLVLGGKCQKNLRNEFMRDYAHFADKLGVEGKGN